MASLDQGSLSSFLSARHLESPRSASSLLTLTEHPHGLPSERTDASLHSFPFDATDGLGGTQGDRSILPWLDPRLAVEFDPNHPLQLPLPHAPESLLISRQLEVEPSAEEGAPTLDWVRRQLAPFQGDWAVALGGAGTRTRANSGVSASSPQTPPSPTRSTLIELALPLLDSLREELEHHPEWLLQLNPTRREAICAHLDRLAGQGPSQSGDADGASSPQRLHQWLELAQFAPENSPQKRAFRTFIEEVALCVLGQALVLKAWSDRGIRPWTATDLSRINWTLATALKPHVPLDREGWQITSRSLYSWYNPGTGLQSQIWSAFENWRITDEGPELLTELMDVARRHHDPLQIGAEVRSYDRRFFRLIWEQLEAFGFSQDGGSDGTARIFQRRKTIFTPTLRDGSMVRTGPVAPQWISLEQNPYLLMIAELAQLWWGPAAPPLWTSSAGLDAFPQPQMSLGLTAPKTTLLGKISEFEACDLGFVLEERAVRSNLRNLEGARLREQADAIPALKRIRAPGTSLGDLQACVTLSKLRPGAMMWWARETRLGTEDGQETLNFLLERGKLIAEWDLSAVEHQLPASRPLFPRFLYMWVRETDIRVRRAHRPLRILVQGQLRSHVEVAPFLSEVLQAALKPESGNATIGKSAWQILRNLSPQPQQEWSERWPDPSAVEQVEQIDRLRQLSMPLAAVTTVRAGRNLLQDNGAASLLGQIRLHGILAAPVYRQGGRQLSTLPVQPGSTIPPEWQKLTPQDGAFMVHVSDESWIAPLRAYLESDWVSRWIDHHSERRGERWILTEPLIKFIPVPRVLLKAMGFRSELGDVDPTGASGPTSHGSDFSTPLPGDWEKLAADLLYQPAQVRNRLGELSNDESGVRIRATLFVRAARAAAHIEVNQARLFSLVTPQGQVRWRELFSVLPKSEFTSVTVHSAIRLSGSLPPHVPVARFDRVKMPTPGIVLSTETGFNLHVASENPRLLDMLWDQVDGLQHPTWGELVPYLRLPRNLEMIEQTAAEVLRACLEQRGKLHSLREILRDSLAF